MNNLRLYCFYDGLIRYYKSEGRDFGFVSVNSSNSILVCNKDIPVIGTLKEVQEYNKTIKK